MNLNFLLKIEAGGSAETSEPSNRLRHVEEYHNFELLSHHSHFNVYVFTYILCMHCLTYVCYVCM